MDLRLIYALCRLNDDRQTDSLTRQQVLPSAASRHMIIIVIALVAGVGVKQI